MQKYIRDITLTLVLRVIGINARILFILALIVSLMVILICGIINYQYKDYATTGAIQINNYNPGGIVDTQIALPDNNRPQDITNYGLASRSEVEEALIKSGYILIPVINKNHLDIKINPEGLPLIGKMLQNFCQNQGNRNMLTGYCTGKLKSLVISQFDVTPEYLNKDFIIKVIAPDMYELYFENKYVLTGKSGQVASASGITIKVDSISAVVPARFILSRNPLDKTISDLFTDITVEPMIVSKNYIPNITGVLKITMHGNKPVLQAKIINDMMEQLKATALQKQGGVLRSSLSFVQQQLLTLSRELSKSQGDMVNFQSSNNVVSLDNQEREYIQQLTTVEQSILENKIAINQFGTLYASKHPLMIDLYTQRDSLAVKKAKLDRELKKLPKNEALYLNLKRNLDVYQQLYSFLLNKEQDLNMKLSSLTSPVEILYYATDKVAPSKNQIMPKVAAGFVIVTLSVMLIVFLNLVFFGNSDPWQISELSHIPLLTIFPFCRKSESKAVQRSFELSASYLLYKHHDHPEVINVGSITTGSGKSFIINGLIKYLNLLNKKCVYINFGLNKAGRDKQYKLISELTTLALKPDKLQGVVILYVNLLDAMDSNKMHELLSRFSHYDYIFMESPPVEQSTLFVNLARISAESILVVAPEDTRNKFDWLINDINSLNVAVQKIIYNNPRKTIFKSIYSIEPYKQ